MSLFSTLSVCASGMAAQRVRAQYLAENMANAETTRTPDGGPYRRKDVIFETAPASSPFSAIFQTEMQPEGVQVAGIRVDEREPQRRYQPGHPDADPQGYVSYPNLSPAEEMVDFMGASRGYQANVAAMTAVKDMIQRSVDLFR